MNRIREARKLRGITMKELGKIVGAAESTISLYETEKRMPDTDVLQKMADYFGVSVDYLIGRDDSETTQNAVQEDGEYERAKSVFNSLSPDGQKQALDYMRFLIEQGKKDTK